MCLHMNFNGISDRMECFFAIFLMRLFAFSKSWTPACDEFLIRATEEELDGWMDGWMVGWMDGWMDPRTLQM